MIHNGIMRVPHKHFLLEDANDLYQWAEATGKNYPAGKWVDEFVAATTMAGVSGLR